MIKITMNRPDCMDEIKILMRMVRKVNFNIDFRLKDYQPVLSTKISPNYKYELGYCNGPKSNHTVIMKLYERINGKWSPFFMPLTRETYDNLFYALRTAISTMPNGKRKLAEDILYIYNRTNPRGYQNPNHIHVNFSLIRRINYMSRKYPERDCLDMWLEWLYLVMLAEFFPKIKENHLFKTCLGKKITFIGLYQCFNTKMTPFQIKEFSRNKSYKYLLKLFNEYFHKFKLQVYSHPVVL